MIPSGEVVRGIKRAAIENPTIPSADDIAKIAAIIKADAVITGVVNEYGQVRSGTTTANVISVSLQMIEKESRKVVWTAATTNGGISVEHAIRLEKKSRGRLRGTIGDGGPVIRVRTTNGGVRFVETH